MHSLQGRKSAGFPAGIVGRGRIILVAAGCILCCVLVLFVLLIRNPKAVTAETAAIDPAIAAMDNDTLQKQIALEEKKILQLEGKRDHLFPGGPVVLVDSATNRITLIKNKKADIVDSCSTGTGLELSDQSGKRSWTFDTPRGFFRVQGKVKNPVWIRPDWAYIEEGTPIPKKREDRAVANVLGDYAIAFGNGYFIHGTLYTRLLGTSVTHGCVRVGDQTLEKIYNTVGIGTPIWIY
jgi:lipoprotein-anchoring transpeptidase ErfK/SrfK